MHVRVVTIVLVLALALVGASCGGDDEGAGDTDTVALTDETATDETATDTVPSFASEECRELAEAAQALTAAFVSATTSGGNLEESSRLFMEFADEAPAEIRADLRILAGAYEEYVDVLRDLDLEPGETPDAEALQKMQQTIASLNEEGVTAASQRLSAWTTENC
jgi:hypothetical protein